MNDPARRIIAALRLEPLPGEGGFFRPTWRSATGSAILFLLTADDFSAVHRIAQEEIWHYYAGDSVEHLQLDPNSGAVRLARLGPAVLAGEEPQVHVPARVWQGARLAVGPGGEPPRARQGFALLGCTVSPPWTEAGAALGRRDELVRNFPTAQAWIDALTR